MMPGKQKLVVIAVVLVSLGFVGTSFANKSSTTIEAPASAVNGSEIAIKVNVSHEGNSFMHYTQWVYVKVNEKEVARWEFSAFNRPESETFVKEIRIKVSGTTEIVAEASCNIHGSSGPAKAVVKMK